MTAGPTDVPVRGTLARADLERLLRERGYSARRARLLVRTVLDAMADSLAAGDDVRLRGFGRFVVRTDAARTARNLSTGGAVAVPSRRRVVFRPAPALITRMTACLAAETHEGRVP